MRFCIVVLVALAASAATSGAFAAGCTPASVPEVLRGRVGAPGAEVYGNVASVHGAMVTIISREGKHIDIDASAAVEAAQAVDLKPGYPVVVLATRTAHGALVAQSIGRAKFSPMAWGPDCFEPAVVR